MASLFPMISSYLIFLPVSCAVKYSQEPVPLGNNFFDLHFDFVRVKGLYQIIKGPSSWPERGIYRGIGGHHEYFGIGLTPFL